MKLHWSPSAPFVQKVMICAEELGVADRIECVRTVVGPARPNADLLPDNPLSKIPAMVLEDGTPLYDSRVICEYLDATYGPKLFPSEPLRRWVSLRRQALGDGMVDILILRRDETLRPEPCRSAAHLSAFGVKLEASLDRAEVEADELDLAAIDIGQIGLACAVAYLDFRAQDIEWRPRRPRLAAWFEGFMERPSARLLRLVDDGKKKV